ncbi:MAG: ribosome biogenesis GTP-binding protein YihA/YsxC [Acidimicrobiia bacterium]
MSSAPLPLRFVLSARDVSALPAHGHEVAVVGRSNVGKSSLLNALGGRKGLAHVSKTPGRTQLLNCYEVEGHDAAVIDCPGYGYAKVSAAQRASWRRMIEGYLVAREELAMVLALVDGEIGPTRLDQDLLAWLRAEGLPHVVVATKADKVRPSRRARRKVDLAAGCDLASGDVVWVSASTGAGVDRLRSLVRMWLDLG